MAARFLENLGEPPDTGIRHKENHGRRNVEAFSVLDI